MVEISLSSSSDRSSSCDNSGSGSGSRDSSSLEELSPLDILEVDMDVVYEELRVRAVSRSFAGLPIALVVPPIFSSTF